MATARDIMNPNVQRIRRDATAAEAVAQMNDSRVSSLMVEKANPRDTYGIVTMGDIVTRVVAKGLPLSQVPVHEIMTKPVIVIMPDLSVKHVARLLANCRISRAPVFDNNELVGIITMHDILADVALIDMM
ncbi:MAG: CBS domain-containing protein [bacterium]|nr:CBS domain-containing protein [bacterium]